MISNCNLDNVEWNIHYLSLLSPPSWKLWHDIISVNWFFLSFLLVVISYHSILLMFWFGFSLWVLFCLFCLQVPPQCPPRPASYTPSSNNEPTPYSHSAAAVLNNLDTLRSYGSAGDELENVPPDYLRNLNRSPPIVSPAPSSLPPPTSATSDSDSIHKPSWADNTTDLNHMGTYSDSSKIKNGKWRVIPPAWAQTHIVLLLVVIVTYLLLSSVF